MNQGDVFHELDYQLHDFDFGAVADEVARRIQARSGLLDQHISTGRIAAVAKAIWNRGVADLAIPTRPGPKDPIPGIVSITLGYKG